MDFNLIISFVAFIGIFKAHQLGWLHWVAAALLAVIVPFVINNFIIGLVAIGSISPLWLIFSTRALIILLLQLIVALYVFRIIKDRDEPFMTWFLTVTLGFTATYLLIPYAVGLIVH